jgi:hypothetical protein
MQQEDRYGGRVRYLVVDVSFRCSILEEALIDESAFRQRFASESLPVCLPVGRQRERQLPACKPIVPSPTFRLPDPARLSVVNVLPACLPTREPASHSKSPQVTASHRKSPQVTASHSKFQQDTRVFIPKVTF